MTRVALALPVAILLVALIRYLQLTATVTPVLPRSSKPAHFEVQEVIIFPSLSEPKPAPQKPAPQKTAPQKPAPQKPVPPIVVPTHVPDTSHSVSPTQSPPSQSNLQSHPLSYAVAPATNPYPYTHITRAEALNAPTWSLPPSILGGSRSNTKTVCSEKGNDYEIDQGPWHKRYENRMVICSGFTTVTCLLESKSGLSKVGSDKNSPPSPTHDPTMRLCWAENLVAPEGASVGKCLREDYKMKEREECAFTAYCSPVNAWADKYQGPGKNDAPMWRAMNANNNPFRSGSWVRKEGEPPVAEDGTKVKKHAVVADAPFGGIGRVAQVDGVPSRLMYFAHGDCGNMWNPGHCNADPVMLSTVQEILGFDREGTDVFMNRGLWYDNVEGMHGKRSSPLFKLWEALAQNVYTRSQMFAHYPVGVVNLAAFGPPSITSVWWGANNCKAKHLSGTWQRFREKVDPYMDRAAVEAWKTVDFESLVQRKAGFDDPGLGWNGDFFGTEMDKMILFVARGGVRQIHNKVALFDEVATAMPGYKILQVEFSATVDYVVQCSLWRRAKFVVGIHGGNLGCSMMLSPGQGMIEGSFGKCTHHEISMFGAAVTHQGAMYRCAPVTGNMNTGGDIDVARVIEGLTEMAAAKRDEHLSTWPVIDQ